MESAFTPIAEKIYKIIFIYFLTTAQYTYPAMRINRSIVIEYAPQDNEYIAIPQQPNRTPEWYCELSSDPISLYAFIEKLITISM